MAKKPPQNIKQHENSKEENFLFKVIHNQV